MAPYRRLAHLGLDAEDSLEEVGCGEPTCRLAQRPQLHVLAKEASRPAGASTPLLHLLRGQLDLENRMEINK